MYNETAKNIRESLKTDCSKCFGLCCTALNIAASSDFAINKPAGTPCPNLQRDFRCKVHKNLSDKGFKGCTVFDCLGAGQKVSQDILGGQSWQEHPEIAKKMFSVFPVMEQIYEMIAFIAEALTFNISLSLQNKLNKQLKNLQGLTEMDVDSILSLDITSCRLPVNELLLETSEYIRNELSSKVFAIKKGKQCRGVDFIGADMRDANLSGANLSTSMFLTQMQINSAKGNDKTILPSHIQPPPHWIN